MHPTNAIRKPLFFGSPLNNRAIPSYFPLITLFSERKNKGRWFVFAILLRVPFEDKGFTNIQKARKHYLYFVYTLF